MKQHGQAKLSRRDGICVNSAGGCENLALAERGFEQPFPRMGFLLGRGEGRASKRVKLTFRIRGRRGEEDFQSGFVCVPQAHRDRAPSVLSSEDEASAPRRHSLRRRRPSHASRAHRVRVGRTVSELQHPTTPSIAHDVIGDFDNEPGVLPAPPPPPSPLLHFLASPCQYCTSVAPSQPLDILLGVPLPRRARFFRHLAVTASL